MRPVKSYIAKRFQNSDAGLSLDTDALARYSDIIDLSICLLYTSDAADE